MWVWSLGQEDPMEKVMPTHFSNLVWRIPWTKEPGGLQFMGLQRVGHNWSDSLCMMCLLKKKIQNWHRDVGWKIRSRKIRLSDQLFPGGSNDKESSYSAGDPGLSPRLGRSPGEGNWLPSPVVLPGEFHAQRSLYTVHKEWDRPAQPTLFWTRYSCSHSVLSLYLRWVGIIHFTDEVSVSFWLL